MDKTTTLSTIISTEVKSAAVAFCKKKGLKLRYFIEQALLDQLEDEIDIEAYRQRKDEDLIPLAMVLGKKPKKR